MMRRIERLRFAYALPMLLLCCLGLALMGGAPASAADYTWDGGDDSDQLWSTADNWDPAGVPGAGDTAKADSGSVIVTAYQPVHSLVVGSGGKVEILDAGLSGTMSRGITNDGDLKALDGADLAIETKIGSAVAWVRASPLMNPLIE